MIKKVVKRLLVGDKSEIRENLEYWLFRSPEERVSTVDFLRRQYHGDTGRLQRVARVISLEGNNF
jgi:hypothetical protein